MHFSQEYSHISHQFLCIPLCQKSKFPSKMSNFPGISLPDYPFFSLPGERPHGCMRWVCVRLPFNAGFRLTCHSPLCRYATCSSLAVSKLQLSAATLLWLYHRAVSLLSWIEFNCPWSAAVGKAVGLSIYWQDAAYRLVNAARQCGKRQASLKPAWHFCFVTLLKTDQVHMW